VLPSSQPGQQHKCSICDEGIDASIARAKQGQQQALTMFVIVPSQGSLHLLAVYPLTDCLSTPTIADVQRIDGAL
jgi:hypothetical protein